MMKIIENKWLIGLVIGLTLIIIAILAIIT